MWYLKENFKKDKGAVKKKNRLYHTALVLRIHAKANFTAWLHETEEQREKIQKLIVLLSRRSIRKIQQYFKASNYMIWTAKIFVAEKVVLLSLNVK
jgi:hypothetical protein